MSKASTMLRLLKSDSNDLGKAIAYNLERMKITRLIPDALYLKIMYRLNIGERLNLKKPINYTEKLQWLKLYYRDPVLCELVDKYRVRDHIAKTIGSNYLIPLLGVWDSFNDIDFDALPDRFVLKCNHDSGSVIICKDKKTFDIEKARKKLSLALKNNMYYFEREWPYKGVKPLILCEEYLEDTVGKALTDYKFFCFNGEPKVMYQSRDKAEEPYTDFFDMDYNHLPIRMRDPNAKIPPSKPESFEKMKQLAATLSKGFPHVRVDFYEVNGAIYFGELTFYHCSGMVKVNPPEWNEKMGGWLILPKTIVR